MKHRISLVCLLLLLTMVAHAQRLTVTRLACEMLPGTVTVASSPRLSWQLAATGNGARQTAYEIAITDRLTGHECWNSGKVSSAQSHLVDCSSAALASGEYVWHVRVWDEADAPSAWSKQAAFRIHTPEEAFAGSRWIGAITRQDARLPKGRTFHGSELRKPEVKAAWEAVDTLAKRSICLRREFRVRKGIKQATVHVCGLGFYELTLNGHKVGESEFAPLWSDYDKSVYYNTYDVTSQLQAGDNAVGVLLGNGFYNVQGGRYRKLQISFGAPTLLFRLHLHYADGTSESVVSDESWKYDLSPVTFNCIYGGEDYDARLEQPGWNKPGFSALHWRNVVLQEAPGGRLRPQSAEPVKIMERYDVQSIAKLTPEQVEAASLSTKRKVAPSAVVLDMGQNLAGFPEIKVRGKCGQKITLLVAESLTGEGACNQRQTGRQHYYEYTLKGEGEETWRPRFSYYGFRYIQLEGAVLKGDKNRQGLPVVQRVQSCFVYNSAPKTGRFECSNPLFNATHRLIEKAVRSNMQSVFTDCPHREKLGWLEQNHLCGPGLLYNYDLTGFLPQTMQHIADAQHSDGAVPTTAPEYVLFEGPGMDVFAQSPEWGCTYVLLPFMFYETYGDDSLIRRHYHGMRRYADYMQTCAVDGIVSFGLGDWYDYGDFRAGFSRNTPVPLVATAHYYLILQRVADAARLLGNRFDAAYYDAEAKKVVTAFRRTFYNEHTGQFGTGSQCSNALPLFLGMVPDEERPKVLANLVADIRKHGNRLTTGDVGNRYLFQTLARNGLNELMYTMHNHEEVPGYGFQLKFGATTLTEQWDPRQGSSWNHFMMGQIDEWFYYSLAGIRALPGSVGMREVEIAPQPVGDLTYVKASTATPYGELSVHWTRENGSFRLNVEVPVGCTAYVQLPGEEERQRVEHGKHSFVKTLLEQN